MSWGLSETSVDEGRAINNIKLLHDDARVQIPVTEVRNYEGGDEVET